MDAILGLLVLVAIYYGIKHTIANARSAFRRRVHAHQARASAKFEDQRRQLQAELRRKDQNGRARCLQLALLGLDKAPDYRRALSWAEKCRDIPIGFRQRQFRRFKQNMQRHLSARLEAGESVEQLMDGLRKLVRALGVAPFEADYMLTEIRSVERVPEVNDAGTFETQLRQLQLEHEGRMNVLRNLDALAPEVLEQLVEAEEARFQAQLFGNNSAC